MVRKVIQDSSLKEIIFNISLLTERKSNALSTLLLTLSLLHQSSRKGWVMLAQLRERGVRVWNTDEGRVVGGQKAGWSMMAVGILRTWPPSCGLV